MKKLYIVGVGMGEEGLLTAQAVEALNSCGEIYAFDRIAQLLSHKFLIKVCNCSQLENVVVNAAADVVGVMVSGDTGFFSAAHGLREKLKGRMRVEILPGISAVQYLCAKLGISHQNFKCVSLHGRGSPFTLLGKIAYNEYTFALTGGENNAKSVLEFLRDKIPDSVEVTAGENFSMMGERIVSGTARQLSRLDFTGLTVLLFRNPMPQKTARHFFDSAFIRGKTPMTKQEIRWSSIGYLEISENDIVYDIGAGTGSVSVEAASFAHGGVVFAVEKQAAAYDLLNENIVKNGAFNVIPVVGTAPTVLTNLPSPTKVFIGGSGQRLEEIVKTVLITNPQVVITVNAVTLETLTKVLEIFKDMNITVSCINSSIASNIGGYNLMKANNPVYIITARGKTNEN